MFLKYLAIALRLYRYIHSNPAHLIQIFYLAEYFEWSIIFVCEQYYSTFEVTYKMLNKWDKNASAEYYSSAQLL